MNAKGFSLIELLIVVAIIGILAMVGIPAYVGQQKSAARSEAYTNLTNLRLLEEQRFADSGQYVAAATTTLITTAMPGFKPGSEPSLQFSYWTSVNAAGSWFKAGAIGKTGSRVQGDSYFIDSNNNKNF